MSQPTFLGPLIGEGAGRCELVNADSGAVLAADVEPAFDSPSRRRGLLGRDSVPEDFALILAPCSAIHTFSMRFPIDAVFVSRGGSVVKTCRGVKPRRVALAPRAFAVIEAAAGFIDRTGTIPGDAVALREIPAASQTPGTWPPRAPRSTPASLTPQKRRTTSPKRVTVADVIARAAPLAWFESVAIVQELCEAVLARGPINDLRVPELTRIAITPAGGVELLAEGPGDRSPVHRAGLALLALTPEGELPTQLRLLVLEEVSPRPRLGTLRDFQTELEFYERPDRREIIRAVCERCQRKPPSPAAEPIPPPLLEPPPPKHHGAVWKNKNVWIGAGILLLTLVMAAAIWEVRSPEGAWLRSGVDRVGRAASDLAARGAAAARTGLAAAGRRIGFIGPGVVTGGRAAAPTAAGTPAASAPAVGGRVIAPAPGGGSPRPIRPAEPASQPQAPRGRVPVPVETPPPADAGVPQAAAPPSAPAEPVPASVVPAAVAVYSASDPLVVPPERIRPRAPGGPPEGTRAEDLAEVEIVVSATGEVESVRLVSPGVGPRSAMMLSAVKAWRFSPATRAGQPVPYKLRMRLPAG